MDVLTISLKKAGNKLHRINNEMKMKTRNKMSFENLIKFTHGSNDIMATHFFKRSKMFYERPKYR